LQSCQFPTVASLAKIKATDARLSAGFEDRNNANKT